MANWSEKMGIASAGVQQQQANNVADASMISGYGNALSSIGSAISNAGYAYMNYNALKSTPNIPPSQSLLFQSGGVNPASAYYTGGKLGSH
jgi:hypothetical protein